GLNRIRTPHQVHLACASGYSRPVVESHIATLMSRGADHVRYKGLEGAVVQIGMTVMAYNGAVLVRIRQQRLSKRGQKFRRLLGLKLPIRRTKSPKAQFSGAALWIDGPWSPGRAVAMLFPRELQLGEGEFHARATGTTGQRDPWAKRLGDDHRARRRCGPPHRADGQNGLCRGARSAYPPALEATGAQLGLDGGHMAGI